VPTSAGVYSLQLFGSRAVADLHAGRHLVIRDVGRELAAADGGDMFRAIGIQAIICAGLVKQGQLVAMMAVHQAQPRDWSADDIALVEEVVDRCWAHIERVRTLALLREQDRNKDEFLATLAHELRNPLAPMRYAAATLANAELAGPQAHARDVIGRQVGLMARLIDDLLDLSRVNRGVVELRRERCEVAPLLDRALEVARPHLDAAQHRLQVEVAAGSVPVDGDADRLVQVVANLLTNAAKYTADGGQVKLSLRTEDAQAVIEVADNGAGIRREDQDRIFEMFTQLPHTADRAKGGLGIGLALSRSLVQLHGGGIRVHSEGEGRGSRFEVRLPLAAPVAASSAAPAPADARSAAPRRVLVVEDLPDSREALLMLLDAMGYEAVGAQDGEEGLQKAAEFRPDVVLLDLGLPGIDGVETGRRLRDIEAARHSRIYALTGWGTPADRERTRQAGFQGHLVKPVALDLLEKTLRDEAH
jgi:signal transduction histidine kinase/CheY-like chemotaxis protein